MSETKENNESMFSGVYIDGEQVNETTNNEPETNTDKELELLVKSQFNAWLATNNKEFNDRDFETYKAAWAACHAYMIQVTKYAYSKGLEDGKNPAKSNESEEA